MLSETVERAGGGTTALLGPDDGFASDEVSTLARPAYLARMAWRLARRAARVSSTDGGVVVNSSSWSASDEEGCAMWSTAL